MGLSKGKRWLLDPVEPPEHLCCTLTMNRSPLNPHDRLFRFAFSEPDVARDFVAHYLPAEISQELDIDTLTPVDGTFIFALHAENALSALGSESD